MKPKWIKIQTAWYAIPGVASVMQSNKYWYIYEAKYEAKKDIGEPIAGPFFRCQDGKKWVEENLATALAARWDDLTDEEAREIIRVLEGK